jgi:hypothetical protein
LNLVQGILLVFAVVVLELGGIPVLTPLDVVAEIAVAAVKIHLLQELTELNQAFEAVIGGLGRMGKVALFNTEQVRYTRAQVGGMPGGPTSATARPEISAS